MLIIFYDNFEKVKNIIQKISTESESLVEKINIFDYLKNPAGFQINSNDVAYFLFNRNISTLIIKKLNKTGCTILNKKFFLKNFDKKKVQELLLKNRISVPNLINVNNFSTQKFILKSKNHTLPVNIFESKEDFLKFVSNKNIDEFYAEEFIEKDAEYKIYYVNGKIFFYDGTEPVCNKKLNKSFEKISRLLKLNIFSVDVLFKCDKFFFIDINPATGLFLSKDARQELLKFVKL